MKCYIGCDPGKSGSILSIYEYEDKDWYGIEWVSLNKPPKEINAWVQKWMDTAITCYVEEVHSMPGQGVKSTFSFGTSFGMCLQSTSLLPIDITMVSPQKWQKYYGLCGGHDKKTDKKNAHKEKVLELFNLDFEVTHRITDAMLIAWYGKLMYEEGTN